LTVALVGSNQLQPCLPKSQRLFLRSVRPVLRNFFLGFLGGVLGIIATNALPEVSDGFAQTAADLGQLRRAENN
jgi:hypothetical protein